MGWTFRDYCTEINCRKIIWEGQTVTELKNYIVENDYVMLFCHIGCFQLWMLIEVDQE